MQRQDYFPDRIEKAFEKNNYELNEEPYHLNLFGIRSTIEQPNKFDDLLGFWYRDFGNTACCMFMSGTTHPGAYWLLHPMNKLGTAIVVPGQYKNLWMIGMHKGKYKALVQINPIKVYRDNDGDNVLDIFGPNVKIQEGMFAIELHHAGIHSVDINDWSAGCQVVANQADYWGAFDVFERQVSLGYKYFDYSLFKEEEV
jgi:hypothetical protein